MGNTFVVGDRTVATANRVWKATGEERVTTANEILALEQRRFKAVHSTAHPSG